MSLQTTDLLLLADGETAPGETKIPPRKPKWYDTFNYIANPDRFCGENLKKYGPIFNYALPITLTSYRGKGMCQFPS